MSTKSITKATAIMKIQSKELGILRENLKQYNGVNDELTATVLENSFLTNLNNDYESVLTRVLIYVDLSNNTDLKDDIIEVLNT